MKFINQGLILVFGILLAFSSMGLVIAKINMASPYYHLFLYLYFIMIFLATRIHGFTSGLSFSLSCCAFHLYFINFSDIPPNIPEMKSMGFNYFIPAFFLITCFITQLFCRKEHNESIVQITSEKSFPVKDLEKYTREIDKLKNDNIRLKDDLFKQMESQKKKNNSPVLDSSIQETALFRFSKKIILAKNPEEVLVESLNTISQDLGYKKCVLFFLESPDSFAVLDQIGCDELPNCFDIKFTEKQGIIGFTVQKRDIISLEHSDIYGEFMMYGFGQFQDPFEMVTTIPFIKEDKIIAILGICQIGTNREFTRKEIALISRLKELVDSYFINFSPLPVDAS